MRKEFLKLSIPNILTNLTVPLVSLVDVGLMGRMPSPNYIIAIGFGTVIFNFLYWALGFLRMGTTGFVAQAYGGKNQKEIQLILAKGVLVAIVASLLILIFKDSIFQISNYLIDTTAENSSLVKQYFDIRIYAAPATIILYVIVGWLLGMQNSKAALILALIVNGVNALISYLLVWEFGYYIDGVAWGTVIAQYAGLIVGIFYLKHVHKVSLKGLSFDDFIGIDKWIRFLKVNSDIFLRTMCLIFTLSFFKVQAGNIEMPIGAANILLLEFITISAYGIDGIAFAAESMCGKYFGLGDKIQFKKALGIVFKWGMIFSFMISIIFSLFGENILHLLTDKQAVVKAAMPFMPWLIIAPVVNGIAFIWDGVYIGCTLSKEMRNTLLIATFIIFLPSFYLLTNIVGNHGMWLALTLFMLTRGVYQSIIAKKTIFQKFH